MTRCRKLKVASFVRSIIILTKKLLELSGGS